jgi:hypothetical protein
MPGMDAAELVTAVRAELAPVERSLAAHRYLAELEAGRVPLESLRAFAGEQRAIITSDRRSFEHLAHCFPQAPPGDFFREMAAGEAEALRLLDPFAAAVGLGADYEPLPGCQAYPAYVAWLALNGSPADVALAFLANLESWGRSCARMRDALRPRHGAHAVAFFDFFAAPPVGFEERALALIATGDPPIAGLRAPLLGHPGRWPSLTSCGRRRTRSGRLSMSTPSCAASAREASTRRSSATTSARTICS